jgi:hypothetical protein
MFFLFYDRLKSLLTLITILSLLFSLLSCMTQWYSNYGINSEKDLYTPSAVPKIVKALEDPKIDIRMYAAIALKKIGGDAVEAIPALSKSVSDSHPNVRMHSIMALREIARQQKDAAKNITPALMTALKDQNYNNRLYAVETLHQIASSDKEIRDTVLPFLKEAMKDAHRNVSFRALRAINDLDYGSPEAIPIYKNNFSSDNADNRRYAILELKPGQYPKPVFYDYLDHMAIHDPHGNVRKEALAYLKQSPLQQQDSGTTPAENSYQDIENSPKGYVQFDLVFTNREFALPVVVKKNIDSHPMPIGMRFKKPFAERPGSHIYILYLAQLSPKHVVVQVEKGKLTVCRINATYISDRIVSQTAALTTIEYYFDVNITVSAPVEALK